MTEFPFNLIEPYCKDFPLDAEKKEKLGIYGELLLEWNQKMNLTAITDPAEIVIKHFFDSMLFLKAVDLPQNASIIDVGTGAGFPGVVLKIMRPDIRLTLLDSLNKRLIFLDEVLKKINLDAELIHARAEEGGAKKELREKFDFASARAVARQNVLAEYCMPFVKPGGYFVALKGPAAAEEIRESEAAVKLLGGAKSRLLEEKLPTGEQRCFIITEKISQTPPKYPRISAKISKQPL
ncbi:MAG: 16S rRNA (guanine(527)-N(7))-methyltransferase RsmG [Clostridiales bacterium]|nr:16S rRNA (guanine(527)-N(7))-methyltransferase RsmG [Candidatus Equinaster intestinalis]